MERVIVFDLIEEENEIKSGWTVFYYYDDDDYDCLCLCSDWNQKTERGYMLFEWKKRMATGMSVDPHKRPSPSPPPPHDGPISIVSTVPPPPSFLFAVTTAWKTWKRAHTPVSQYFITHFLFFFPYLIFFFELQNSLTQKTSAVG